MTQAEQVLIRGKCFLYKQKAPFVQSGKSVYGALEYDESSDTVRCHECGEWMRALGHHARKVHSLTPLEYRLAHGLNRRTALCGIRLGLAIADRSHTKRLANLWKAKSSVPRRAVGAAAQARREGSLSPHRITGAARDLRYEQRNERGQCHAQLADAIKSLASKLGRTPTNKDLSEVGIHASSACVAFNVRTMSDLISLIGLRPNPSGGAGHLIPAGFSREELIEIIRDFYVKHGRLPKQSDARLGIIPTAKVFHRLFGSMHDAYVAAGLANAPHRLEWTESALVGVLRAFHEKHGRLPRHRPNEFSFPLPRPAVFRRVFGSISRAYEAAGLRKVAEAA